MKITQTQLYSIIKEELTAFYVTPEQFAKEKNLKEIKFIVKIVDLGNVIVDGSSEGEVRTRLIKKIRGGKDSIESITRISKDKAAQASKRLGIEPNSYDGRGADEKYGPRESKMPLQEMQFVVKTDNIGDIIVTGKSEGEVRMRLMKKIRGGKNAILDIRRVSKDKSAQASKRLGISANPGTGPKESAVSESTSASRQFDKHMQTVEKTMNIIKQSLGYLKQRQQKNPDDTKQLMLLVGVKNKIADVEKLINKFPQD